MGSQSKETKLARKLQKLSGKSVPYMTCLNLLQTRGYVAAEAQIKEWNAAADAELGGLSRTAEQP